MKYLCLGYHDPAAWAAVSEIERNALLEDCLEYDQELSSKGYSLKGHALPAARTAITLRFEHGSVAVSEGPFAGSQVQLGGILLLEAEDLNHAIQLMSKLPSMRLGGSLEIRPVRIDGL